MNEYFPTLLAHSSQDYKTKIRKKKKNSHLQTYQLQLQ